VRLVSDAKDGRDISHSCLRQIVPLFVDWAASVATVRPWQGRKTVKRRVLYVVGEGAFGFKGRAAAWETGWDTQR
jgi:hypothetical protein